MKIAIGSDERTYVTDAVMAELARRGHELLPFGPLRIVYSDSAAPAPEPTHEALPPAPDAAAAATSALTHEAMPPAPDAAAAATPATTQHAPASPHAAATPAPDSTPAPLLPLSLSPPPTPWPAVARAVAEAVAGGAADEGILFCWTGTGVTIAANKVRGIRAALCDDAETARGARLWNDANVLCLSLRRTSAVMAEEILDMWFKTSFIPNDTDNACLAQLDAMESNHETD